MASTHRLAEYQREWPQEKRLSPIRIILFRLTSFPRARNYTGTTKGHAAETTSPLCSRWRISLFSLTFASLWNAARERAFGMQSSRWTFFFFRLHPRCFPFFCSRIRGTRVRCFGWLVDELFASLARKCRFVCDDVAFNYWLDALSLYAVFVIFILFVLIYCDDRVIRINNKL